MKKCQSCAKPAVFHVTEIEDDVPTEIHFCEEHFHAYMKAEETPAADLPDDLAADTLKAVQAMQEISEAAAVKRGAGKRCPHCGISFHEFREKGRFGCPGDYEAFREQLVPLVENIHDATRHVGKVPAGAAGGESSRQFRLIRLRKDLAKAVAAEEYEKAASLRDEIGALGGVESE
ncbi:UvrB/UvrC motif-containing protein [Alienimonas chondri]|uniref:Protein-arginine kinase activator protein n=1 Tax=Alienimonas chondri TaxID=2681879 RepID=A0ABX1VCU3_9PLAN|nr:UvrB/UvrC motif-containing protein [Alienimonas chondri]NNJ25534.1 Protein-arginine kinase activator protein [Alienimonas chondri]